jgi:hypothetical protein
MRSLRRLFACPAHPTARPKARLGLTALEDRSVPAVTSHLLTDGMLDILPDAADNVVVVARNTTTNQIEVRDLRASTVQSYDPAQVTSIRYRSAAGGINLKNQTAIPLTADLTNSTRTNTVQGGSGDDVFRAGQGTDFLDGGDGNDVFYTGPASPGLADQFSGGPGDDVVVRQGSGPFVFNGGPGSNPVLGDDPGQPTDQDLQAAGQGTVYLQGNTLHIVGPSGHGMQIVGHWQTSSDGGQKVFTASGAVALRTALGDIPLVVPDVTPIRITAQANTWSRPIDNYTQFGVFTQGTFAPLPLDASDGPLAGFLQQDALNVSLPGASLGIKLGSQLGSLGAPLNPALPYLYATASTGASASYGGVQVGLDGNSMTAVFDPADPFIYLQADNFAFGGSLNGQIPFQAWAQSGAVPLNSLYGHLYGKGSFSLGELPLSVTGEAVINLDANPLDGPVPVNGRTVWDVINSLPVPATSTLKDVQVGINGEVDLGYQWGLLDMTLPLALASVMYEDGWLGARATSASPFDGTALSFLHSAAGFDVDASCHMIAPNPQSSFSMMAQASGAWFGSFQTDSVKLVLNQNGVEVVAGLKVPFGLQDVTVSGQVMPNGNFTLADSASKGIDFGIGSAETDFNFVIKKSFDTYYMFGLFSADLDVGSGDWSLNAGVTGSVQLNDANGAWDVSGSVKLDGGFSVGGISVPGGVSVSGSLNENGFHLNLPSPLPDINVSW